MARNVLSLRACSFCKQGIPMTGPTALIPARPVPELNLLTAEGGSWTLNENPGKNFTLAVFYRGYHCPKCKEQLLDIQDHLAELHDKGTRVVAISMDPPDRVEKTRDEWDLNNIRLLRGLTIETARNWGLHISSGRGKTSIGVEELHHFNEPGTFLIRNDGTLYASWVQTVPFARPKTADLVSMIGFILEKDYPPRGTAKVT